ncbi:hypothetical protein PG994_006199 [Apiospora phragmitis]|uniref:O-methyltransferase domain-containing protein n=1 Tax=Apiospora phragmitis TaxID=2905665 RepID=A0ABR1VEC7_9PEZI
MSDDPAAREKLVESARELVLAAETPMESLLWHIWALPTRTVAARIAVDLKIFETAVLGSRPKSNEDLAAATGASPTLVKRISCACVSMGMLNEQGPDLYASFAKLPEYLRNTKFQNPEIALDGPFQYANEQKPAFAWLTEHPEVFEAFHNYIHTLRQHRPSWTDMYPPQSRLVEGLKPHGDASAFVDVGSSIGQILQDSRTAVPQCTGRLVLQELPEVITAATEKCVGADGRIELQAHDFFTPQPVKGARAYFMRTVLHDWPDEQCRKILTQLKDAMEPGYSRILISDCATGMKFF